MNPEDKARFDAIVAKDPPSLTEAEIAVLRARASYLDEEQLAKFAGVLGVNGDQDEDAGKPLEDHSNKELKKLAKSLDINPNDFKERDKLIAAIREKQQAGQ